MKQFLKIKETKDEIEIVSQNGTKIVRCACTDDGSGHYITLVELEAQNVTTR